MRESIYKSPPFLNDVVSAGEEAGYSLSAASNRHPESGRDCPLFNKARAMVDQPKGAGVPHTGHKNF